MVYHFDVYHGAGNIRNNADAISRPPFIHNFMTMVSEVDHKEELIKNQDSDPFCSACKSYLKGGNLPTDPQLAKTILNFIPYMFLHEGILIYMVDPKPRFKI